MSNRATNPVSTPGLAKNARSMGIGSLAGKKNASEEDQSERLDGSVIHDRSNEASLRVEQHTILPNYSGDERASNSYNAHSNNSPDDSLLQPRSQPQKQLKWILVSEPQDPGRSNSGSQRGDAGETSSPPSHGGQSFIQTPQIKNHTSTLYNSKLYIFGGYDGKKNHCNLRVFDTEKDCWLRSLKPGGTPPQGRNGHTATLVGKFE